MAYIPENVEQYRQVYESDNPGLKNVSDEDIALKVFSIGQKTGDLKGKSFEEFSMDFLSGRPENSAYFYRKKYENQFPEIKNLTDADLANKVYDQRVSLGGTLDFKTFANKFAPKDYVEDFVSPDDINFYKPRPAYSTQEIAKLTGIDLPTDVTDNTSKFFGPKLVASFGQGEENKILAYKNSLSKFFNKDVDVRVGPKTGEIEFLNPVTQKYTLANQPGFDAGDVASYAGDALVLGPMILGDIYGGPAGGAFLAGVGEALRVQLGKSLFGLNEKVNPLLEGTKEAAIVGTLGYAGSKVSPALNWMENWVKTGRVNFSELEQLTKNSNEAKLIFDKFNNELARMELPNKVQYTLGQASNDPKLLSVQAAFESDPKYGLTGFYNTWNRQNAEALDAYFGLLNKGIENPSITKDVIGQKINEVMTKNLDPVRKTLLDAQTKAEADLTGVTLTLPNGVQKESGDTIRSTIQELQKKISDEFDLKYDALFASGGGRVVYTDLITDAINSIDKRQKTTLFAKYPDIESIIKKPGITINIDALKNTRSDLKAADRATRSTNVSETPIEGAYKQLIGSIDKQLAKDLPANDPWLIEFNSLTKNYKEYKDKFNGVIKQLLKLENGRLKIADEDVFLTTFKYGRGSQDKIDSIYDVIKHDSGSMTAYRDSILDFYRNKVVDQNTGLINKVAHDRFVKNYEYPLKVFFGEKNYGQISKIGELGKTAQELKINKENVLKELSDSTEGQIEKLEPDLIFNKLYSPEQPTRLKSAINIIKKDPETINGFQTLVKKDMQNSIKNEQDQFDFVKFNNYLKKNEQNLKTVFYDDPKYVENLKDFNKVLKILSRESPQGAKVDTQFNSALNDYLRMRVGMFTEEGRIYTMAKKIVNWRKLNQMQKIITNPKEVEKLLSLKNLEIPVPKDYGPTLAANIKKYSSGDEKTLKANVDLYNTTIAQLFGDKAVDESNFFEGTTRKEGPKTSKEPNRIKRLNERMRNVKPTIEYELPKNITPVKPVSQAPTQPKVNMFASNTPGTPVTTGVAPTEQPANNAMASIPTAGGLTNIPQDQLNKYNTLFGPLV